MRWGVRFVGAAHQTPARPGSQPQAAGLLARPAARGPGRRLRTSAEHKAPHRCQVVELRERCLRAALCSGARHATRRAGACEQQEQRQRRSRHARAIHNAVDAFGADPCGLAGGARAPKGLQPGQLPGRERGDMLRDRVFHSSQKQLIIP